MNKTLTNYFNCRLLLVILLVGVMGNGRAQNLVPNPSFEIFNVSCSNIGQSLSPQATSWSSPIINAKFIYSYYNACATQPCCSVPYNSSGRSYQYAHSGNAYVGMNSMGTYGYNLRHYIQNKLMDSLKANHCYYVEFYINKHDAWIYATNNMGLLIGDTAILSYKNIFTPANPQIQLYDNPAITDTMNWIKVGGVYTAHGGEQYITIGNFKDDAHTDTIRFQQYGNTGGGYYIDDVSVIPLDSMQLKADAGRDTTIVKGDSVWIGSRLCGLTNVVWYDAANNVIDTGAPGLWVKPTSNTFYVIEQNVCGQYSRDTVFVSVVPLPVVIMNYELIINNGIQNTVENVWTTSSEVNVSHYNVQRSLDGLLFNTVGKVPAKGASKYSFIDNTNLNGTVYYRLEIVDKNGNISYSEIRTLSIINAPLSITPNPAKDFVTITAKNLQNIRILDNTGRVVITKEGILANTITINISSLSKGLYFVKATDANGAVRVAKMAVLK